MAAKDRTWAQTKTGGTGPLKLFYAWFENIVFAFVRACSPPNASFSLHVDDDGGSADDEIGSAVLHLHHQSADEPWSVDGRWLALRNSKHKPCGEVKIAVER